MKSPGALLALPILLACTVWGFESPECGFSISTPPGWNRLPDSTILALYEGPGTAGYPPRFVMNVLDRTRVDLEAMASQTKGNYLLLFTDFVVVHEEYEEVQGLEAWRMTCRWKQGRYDLMMDEVVIRNLNRFYDFGLIANESDFASTVHLLDVALGSLSFFEPWYRGEYGGLVLRYPRGWALDEASFSGMVVFYGPEDDAFLTNVVLASEPWNGTTEGYAGLQRQEMEELLTGIRLLEEGTVAMPVGLCRYLVYSYEMPGPGAIRARGVFTVRDGMAHSMVYTSIPAVYESYLPQFDGMLSTLEIREWVLACIPILLAFFRPPRGVIEF